MRLIDADALTRTTLTESCFDSQTEDVFLDLVDAQPTIEAEPVRHGRWEEEDERSAYKDFLVSCSNCGALLDKNNALHFKYCYNCGAIMDGGGER